MAFNLALRPFIINLDDIQFILDQVEFQPLFDVGGNAIVGWDGSGAIYDQNGDLLDRTGLSDAQAIALYGTSYLHVTSFEGVRDVQGLNNNLLLVNATWGSADAPFVRLLDSNYDFVQQDLSAPLGTISIDSVPATTNIDETIIPILVGNFGGVDVFVNSIIRVTTGTITETTTTDNGHLLVSTNTRSVDETTLSQIGVADVTGETIHTTFGPFVNPLHMETFLSGGELDPNHHNFSAVDVTTSATQGYAPTSVDGVAVTAADFENGTLPAGADANSDVRVGDVIDYTPRMISQTITTGGAEMLTVRDLYDNPNDIPATLDPDHIVYNTEFLNDGVTANPEYTQGQDPTLGNFKLGAVERIAIVKDGGYGLLEELGLQDNQNPNNDEFYIGSVNPGVAPTNGFFGIFGQFFDHGLDFIAKNGQTDGGQTAKIKIALAVDDPLYGAIGPDGRETKEITITRATPAGVDENGDVAYINHTSPFVDQSQSYGSHAQIEALMREWVEDPNAPAGTYIQGTDLVDSFTLKNTWSRWDGVETDQTLVNVNALRQHMVETGRDDLNWEDIGNVRNRDASGDVDGTGSSGHALLLDMNPRFDGQRLDSTDVIDGIGTTVEDVVNNAVLDLDTILVNEGLGTLSQNGNGDLQLDLVAGAMGPGSPATTFTGAGALAPFVNFADFSIHTTLFGMGGAAVDVDAVSDILIASVGDHYLSGDGRVNENVGLTTIHHVFHEEHNFQVYNMQNWILSRDAKLMDDDAGYDQSGAHDWQTAVTNLTGPSANTNVSIVPDLVIGNHYEATGGLVASDENGDFYVVDALATLPADHSFVRRPPEVDAAGNQSQGAALSATGLFTDANGYLSWNQDKIFEGVKLIVDTEYNHVATDQFAGAITPDIPEFVGYNSGIDSSISLEFSQNAYRYGHSTLRETIDVIDPDGGLSSRIMSYALEAAFLKPELYAELGPDAITLGQTRQQMNEIDEFITPALNQGLLGLPLDLAAINIARGRDVGLPTFNDMRVALGFEAYASWNDVGNNMQHGGISLVNFMAAYAFDGDVAQAKATLDASNGIGTAQEVSDAIEFMSGGNQDFNFIDAWMGGIAEVHVNGGLLGETFNSIFVNQIAALKDGDRFYYLYRLFGEEIDEQIKAEQFKDIVERTTGTTHLNGNVFGYAEEYQNVAFNATWATNIYLYNADGDVLVAPDDVFDPGVTYYDDLGAPITGIPTAVALYLSDLGSNGGANLPDVAIGDVPVANTVYYDADGKFIGADQHKYGQIIAEHATDPNGTNINPDGSETANTGVGIFSDSGGSTQDNGQLFDFDSILAVGMQQFIKDIRTGAGRNDQLDGEPGGGPDSHEVIVGTDFNDVIYARAGDDTVYGEGGNDLIFGGNGADALYGGDGHDVLVGGDGPEVSDGGAGDDILFGDTSESAAGGTDLLIGGIGNDIIYGGVGIDELIGNAGDDILFGGGDTDPFTRAGDGNDYVDGGAVGDNLYGDDGDDLIVGGDDQDIVAGGDGDDILRPGRPSQALGGGPDEVLGGNGTTDNGFDLVEFNDYDLNPLGGVDIDLTLQGNPLIAIDFNSPLPAITQLEGIIGTQNDDTLTGDSATGPEPDEGQVRDGANWLIGGTGNDTLEGAGGNDLIVGGSIRLDSLIGQYELAGSPGVRVDYDFYDAFEGASHRAADGSVLSDGLLGSTALGTTMFGLHFTDFLKTDMFKDYVLGDADEVFDPLNPPNGATGSGAAAADDFGPLSEVLISNSSFEAQSLADGEPGVNMSSLGNWQAVDPTGWTFAGTGKGAIWQPDPSVVNLAGHSGGNVVAIQDGEILSQDTGQDLVEGSNYQLSLNVGDRADIGWAGWAGWAGGEARLVATDGITTVVLNTLNLPEPADGEWVNVALDSGPISAAHAGFDLHIEVEAFGINMQVLIDNVALKKTATTDVAVFSGNRADYTVETITYQSAYQGEITAFKLTDTRPFDASTGLMPDGTPHDGTDLLVGIEEMRFADITLNSFQFGNTLPSGSAVISGFATANTQGFLSPAGPFGPLTVNTATIADLDGLGPLSFQWQSSSDGATWADISGTLNPEAITDTFQPTANEVGSQLRVVVSYTDNAGVPEQVISAPTDFVGEYFDDLAGNNELEGTDGQDILIGRGGGDQLQGGDGNDWFNGGGGGDNIQGGAGDDTINGRGGNDTIVWDAGDGTDTVNGGNNSAVGDTFEVNGNGDSETYDVYASDMLPAPYGAPTEIVITRTVLGVIEVVAALRNIEELVFNLTASGGADSVTVHGTYTGILHQNTITINAPDGNVTIDISQMTSDEHVVLNVGTGNYEVINNGTNQVEVNAAPGSTVVVTDPVADTGTAPAPQATQFGTDTADELNGTDGADMIFGDAGNDSVFGKAGADDLFGNDDNDVVFGDGGADRLFGGSGDDFVDGGEGADIIFGNDGDDVIVGGEGGDMAWGGSGNDVFRASAGDGNDWFHGGDDIDTLDLSTILADAIVDLNTNATGFGTASSAETGTDMLDGIENVFGGSGDDTFIASDAANLLIGGEGNDIFRFDSAAQANGDTIAGFTRGGDLVPGDKVDLSMIDPGTGNDGGFQLLDQGEFFGATGQVRLRVEDGNTFVEGNTDGDGETIEFSIEVVGVTDLQKSDFNGIA